MAQLIRYVLVPAIVGGMVGFVVLLFLGRTEPPSQNPSFATAVRAAAPSVVNIYSTRSMPARHPVCDLPRFRDLCEAFSGSSPPWLGSGVIVRTDGYILTNQHVIDAADEIVVAFPDGTRATADIVATDPETDLAVIKVAGGGFNAIDLGSSDDAEVGDVVLAIGNPFDLGQTVSMGIISAKGRYGLSQSPYENFIQTDAAINPGNSGGALINTDGHLIGINSLIFSRSGSYQGIGFAIPTKLAMEVLSSIITEGRVIRGWLGIEVANNPGTAGMGLTVQNVLPSSPAEMAGLARGDVILTINDQPAVNSRVVTRQIALTAPGSDIKLNLVRNGQELEIHATAGVRPLPESS
jgi:serine protease DegS